jgi:tRNA(fMet)-specific endonuclease VapC
MMFLLDTQHVSQLQRESSRDSQLLESKLAAHATDIFHITIITAFEKIWSCSKKIDNASGPVRLHYFTLLHELIEFYARWSGRILPFDGKAASIFSGFDKKMVRRIGREDAWIASIALAHDASVLTANLSDFQQVPGLRVEDWLTRNEAT